MNAQGWQFAVFPGGQPGRATTPPGRDYQELWFRVALIPWASLVLVPADGGTSAAEVATALAEVGTSLRGAPITAIVADRIDYDSARALTDMQPRLTDGNAPRATVDVEAEPVPPDDARGARPHVATPFPPTGRAIIAIKPIVDEPLGLAIAQAADAVLLCVEMGRSRIGAVRRTVELIGAQRVIGALVIR